MKIPIVDKNDNFLYLKDKKERNLRKEITRSSTLWAVNEKKEILIAKRANKKINFPNIWGPSASGGVDENESYKTTLIRETKEEIGIDLEEPELGPKERMSDYHEFFNHYFFVQLSSNTKFTLQESEVDEVRWISLKELKNWYEKNPEEFIPAFDISLEVIENYDNQS